MGRIFDWRPTLYQALAVGDLRRTENPKWELASSGKTVVHRGLVQPQMEPSAMAEECKPLSDLPEVTKLNGEFRKNYGKILGAFLYLRSISAARGRSWFWTALLSTACSTALAWLGKPGMLL
ncbi:hypothetical protein [Bradyrhizobium vignae]|uniref:hypothetical protein n=1 Tax=Bradyrhizobium vignae TaxID=1549949 RepID=UPI001FE1219D|nr:hypothetical protein [Bradyrhizobium vignae]